MNLTLPPDIESKLTPQNAVLNLAIGLFVSEEVTLGQAAQIAGLPQATFLRELGKRRIPIHYGPDELAEELKAIDPDFDTDFDFKKGESQQERKRDLARRSAP